METDYWTVIMCMLIIAGSGCFVIAVMSVPVGGSLIEDVKEAPYSITDYKLHRFDCSNMAAVMEDHLTERGYEAKILVLTRQAGFGHSMVSVYNTTEYYCDFVECTAKCLVDETFTEYDRIREYEDVIDAAENSGWGIKEFGMRLYLEKKGRGVWKR